MPILQVSDFVSKTAETSLKPRFRIHTTKKLNNQIWLHTRMNFEKIENKRLFSIWMNLQPPFFSKSLILELEASTASETAAKCRQDPTSSFLRLWGMTFLFVLYWSFLGYFLSLSQGLSHYRASRFWKSSKWKDVLLLIFMTNLNWVRRTKIVVKMAKAFFPSTFWGH